MFKKVIVKIAISLFGIILGLIICEFLLRIFWNPPFLNSKYQRNDLKWLTENVILDRYNYRDRDFPLIKKPGVFRIYSLGDSYTFGWYLPNHALTYPKVLEKIIQKKYGQDKIEVINASQHGFSLEDEVGRLQNEGVLFSPDLVTVGINIWDIVGGEKPESFTENKFLRSLRDYQILFGQFEQTKTAQKTLKLMGSAYQDNSSEMKQAEKLFSELKLTSDSIGANIVVILFPEYEPAHPNNSYKFQQYHDQMKKIGEKYSIQIIDLLEPFSKYADKRDLVLNPTDPHPSALADQMAGEYIARQINFEKLFNQNNPQLLVADVIAQPGSILPNFIGAISITPNNWVYFDRRFQTGVQKHFLPDFNDRKIIYLNNYLETAQAFTHQGWPGAKIEYYLPADGNQIVIPRTLFGYKVLGVSAVRAYYREEGSLKNEGFNLSQLLIHRDDQNIHIEHGFDKKIEYYKLNIDIAVGQIDIDGGSVASVVSTKLLNDKILQGQQKYIFISDSKISSWPFFIGGSQTEGYMWIDDKMRSAQFLQTDSGLTVLINTPVTRDSTIEIPLSLDASKTVKYPTIEYLRKASLTDNFTSHFL